MNDNAARALLVDEEPISLVDLDLPEVGSPRPRRFERPSSAAPSSSRRERTPAARRDRTPARRERAASSLRERPSAERRPAVSTARSAPGRAYGSHRRADSIAEAAAIAGYQPGRRTVAITGQAQAPRRRSQTASAITARPDRTALWAFLFALFLLVMAVATAHG